MAKWKERKLTPDDPLFRSSPQVFTPIARPASSNVVRKLSTNKEHDRLLMQEIEESMSGASRRPAVS